MRPPQLGQDDREVGDGTALERNASIGQRVFVSAAETKAVTARATLSVDVRENGNAVSAAGVVLMRPASNVELQLSPQVVFDRGEPRFAVFDDVVPVFGRLNAKSVGVTLRGLYTLSPRLSLQAYAQAFLATGHFTDFMRSPAERVVSLTSLTPGAPSPTNPDFQQGVLNVSLVLCWEYRLGSMLDLVYTRSQSPSVPLGLQESARLSPSSLSRAPAADLLLLKLSYWWST